MKIQAGRKIAIAVDSKWYSALEGHRFLKGGHNSDHPTDVLTGTFDYDDHNGMWVKPAERFSDFSNGSLFIPWRYIVSAVLLGPDDEEKVAGFAKASTPSFQRSVSSL